MSEQTAPEIVIDDNFKEEFKRKLSLLTDEEFEEVYRLVMRMGGAAGE